MDPVVRLMCSRRYAPPSNAPIHDMDYSVSDMCLSGHVAMSVMPACNRKVCNTRHPCLLNDPLNRFDAVRLRDAERKLPRVASCTRTASWRQSASGAINR
jgi:hypothetical protein